MIIVRLSGGLGNQLFQYAAARRLSHMHDTELVCDTSWFSMRHSAKTTPRSYELFRYPIKARQMTPDEAKWSRLYSGKILKRLPLPRPWKWCRDRPFHFDPQVLHLSDNVYLDGYWQCPNYFEDISSLLQIELTPFAPFTEMDTEVARAAESANSVSIHVRRGDYVSSPSVAQIHGTCSLDYYRKAVELIMEKVSNPHFFVFSDDPEWTRDNLQIDAPTHYVTHNGPDTAFQDLRLMSVCRHQIIANSSFSWWGAWLNANAGKIVIAPEVWLQNRPEASSVIPKSWIRI